MTKSLLLSLQQAFSSIEASELEHCVAQMIAPKPLSPMQQTNRLSSFDGQGIGGLMVMTDSSNQPQSRLWIRNFLPQSHYPVEDIEELLAIIDGVIHDEVFWVMEYQLDNEGDVESLQSVSLIDSEDWQQNPISAKEDTCLQVLSWSGKFDTIV